MASSGSILLLSDFWKFKDLTKSDVDRWWDAHDEGRAFCERYARRQYYTTYPYQQHLKDDNEKKCAAMMKRAFIAGNLHYKRRRRTMNRLLKDPNSHVPWSN